MPPRTRPFCVVPHVHALVRGMKWRAFIGSRNSLAIVRYQRRRGCRSHRNVRTG